MCSYLWHGGVVYQRSLVMGCDMCDVRGATERVRGVEVVKSLDS